MIDEMVPFQYVVTWRSMAYGDQTCFPSELSWVQIPSPLQTAF